MKFKTKKQIDDKFRTKLYNFVNGTKQFQSVLTKELFCIATKNKYKITLFDVSLTKVTYQHEDEFVGLMTETMDINSVASLCKQYAISLSFSIKSGIEEYLEKKPSFYYFVCDIDNGKEDVHSIINEISEAEAVFNAFKWVIKNTQSTEAVHGN